MSKKRGRRQIETEKRDTPLGLNVSGAVKRRLEWIAKEESISMAEMLSQLINERAEEIAKDRAVIDRPRSIRELLRVNWLKVIDSGLISIEEMIELKNGRLATEADVLVIASILGMDEEFLLGLERNGRANGVGQLSS